MLAGKFVVGAELGEDRDHDAPGNRLDIEVRAGEMIPFEQTEH